MLEHSQPAVVLQVHVQPHAVPSLAQDAGQRRLAHLQRLAPQVLTVEFQQVKGGIAQNLYYRWSKDFLEAGKKRLAGDTARAATSDEVNDLRREAMALKEVVADLTLGFLAAQRGPVALIDGIGTWLC